MELGKTTVLESKNLMILPSVINIGLMSEFKWALLMVPSPKKRMFLPKLVFAVGKS